MNYVIIIFYICQVWHPRCGPCPSAELGGVLNGSALLGGHPPNGNVTDTDCDHLSNSAISEMQVRVFFIFFQLILY